MGSIGRACGRGAALGRSFHDEYHGQCGFTGVQQFLEILTVPDNIPIIAMMILVMFFTYIALKQARRNDQLIEHGHRERIIDEMRK